MARSCSSAARDAWARLLATFRAVHGGVRHEALSLPAYGGALFDPDRYPFLEGRPRNTGWRQYPAQPLPITNRTVLHLLEALQYLRERGGEARRLSYLALGIEQIGHVYEGLLDHTARRATEPMLGVEGGTEKGLPIEPEIALANMEQALARGRRRGRRGAAQEPRRQEDRERRRESVGRGARHQRHRPPAGRLRQR